MKSLNEILTLMKQGGAISYILTILYIIVMVIAVERTIYFYTRSYRFSYVKKMLKTAIESKDISIFQNDALIQKHKKAHTIHIVNYYIANKHLAEEADNESSNGGNGAFNNAFNEAIERESFIILNNMERYIWILSQVGHIGPLLGLLGTVVGLIEAFRIMATLGVAADVSSFADGIWVAMITTANGLIVAIPSFLLFRIFERIIEKRGNQITILISMLNQYFGTNSESRSSNNNSSLYNNYTSSYNYYSSDNNADSESSKGNEENNEN